MSRATLRKAKILAARRDTQQIEILVGEEEAYERTERQAIQLLNHGFHLGGLASASRDDVHDR